MDSDRETGTEAEADTETEAEADTEADAESGDKAGDGPADGRHRHRRAPRSLLRWLPRRRAVLVTGGAGAALAAAAVAVIVSLSAGAVPACAAPPVAGTEYAGQATHYLLTAGGGNCSYPDPPADNLYVALSPAEYGAAAACGGYLEVTGPAGTVRVKVVDQCPECATGHIDLSRDAFARIADLSAGIVPVTYRMVADPPLPGPLGFRVKDGASQYWFAVLVSDHGNPLATVSARAAGGQWRALVRQEYNYWLAEDGLGPGPYELEVTDVAGHTVTVPGIALAPEQPQTTSIRMYGEPGEAPPAPQPAPPPAPPGSPSPAPSPHTEPAPGTTPTAPATAAAAAASPSRPACQ